MASRCLVVQAFLWLYLSIVGIAESTLPRVQVTLRGQVYFVYQVSTIRDLQEQLERESGLDLSELGRVTFHGQVLPDDATTALADCGLKDGDQINMVPQRIADHWTMMRNMGMGLNAIRNRVHLQGPFASPEEKQQVQILTDLWHGLVKTPYLPQEMERFAVAIKDPVALERARDPEWIESMRQVILNNPLLLKHMTECPKAARALQSPDDWYQYILDSIESWQRMTPLELWKRFSEGRIFGGKE